MQSFHFKTIRNIFFTNKKLFKCGMISSPMSLFSTYEIETLEHLFVNRDYVKSVLNRLANGIAALVSNDNLMVGISMIKKLKRNSTEVVNYTIFINKYSIFL